MPAVKSPISKLVRWMARENHEGLDAWSRDPWSAPDDMRSAAHTVHVGVGDRPARRLGSSGITRPIRCPGLDSNHGLSLRRI